MNCEELLKKDISTIKEELKKRLESLWNNLKLKQEKMRHGTNILRKVKDVKKNEKDKIIVLCKAIEGYEKFLNSMCEDSSPQEVKSDKNLLQKIKCFKSYREYVKKINKKNIFSSQSKFESSIMEEFLYHLFKEYEKENIEVGSIKAYTSLYFSSKSFKTEPEMKINEKNQDFAIYRRLKLELKNENKNSDTSCVLNVAIPVIAIECKTYLDKTMLEGSIATAEKIKMGNPHCKFFILTEAYNVKYEVDVTISRIDNIFVLRKGKSSENKDIDENVMIELYKSVKDHLEEEWENIEDNIKEHGMTFLKN